jgi:hypothetical protein
MLIHYPNWRPEDMKAMTSRQREYWVDLSEYVTEKRRPK